MLDVPSSKLLFSVQYRCSRSSISYILLVHYVTCLHPFACQPAHPISLHLKHSTKQKLIQFMHGLIIAVSRSALALSHSWLADRWITYHTFSP